MRVVVGSVGGGIFAVFAKIPPPIPSPAAHPTEASIPCGDSRMAM